MSVMTVRLSSSLTSSTTPQIPLLFTMADTRACTLKGKQEGALSDLIMDSQRFLSPAAQLLSIRKLMRGACEMRADFSIRKFACDLNERLFALRSSAPLWNRQAYFYPAAICHARRLHFLEHRYSLWTTCWQLGTKTSGEKNELGSSNTGDRRHTVIPFLSC